MIKPIVLTWMLVLGHVLSSKVAILSYNTAGVFRRYSEKSVDINLFKLKLVNDLNKESAKNADLIILAYQEIWDVSNTIIEAFRKIADVFGDSLDEVVLKFSIDVIKEVFKDKSFDCEGKQNHSLMTVACRQTEATAQALEPWFKEAFKQGWDEGGRETNNFILGFKGILGTFIELKQRKKLLIVNLHLSSKDFNDRKKAIIKAKELAQPHLETGNFIFVMVGDFNARSFSLALSDPAKFNDYNINVGAAFLMLCLTDTIGKSNFIKANHQDFDCSNIIEFAKKYDDINFIFKHDFDEMAEVGDLHFDPTFCFNFHATAETKNHPRLCPKENEVVPSFTDRIFYLPNPAHPITWIEYTSIKYNGIEPSDHIPILGVFEISYNSATNNAFSPPKKDQAAAITEKPEDTLAKAEGPPFSFKNYKKDSINYNKMVEKLTFKDLFAFLALAKKKFEEAEKFDKEEKLKAEKNKII